MRLLSGLAVILTPLTDLFSGLRVVTRSSCFSDRNIWDFLSPEAGVSWYFPFSSSEVNLQYRKTFQKLTVATGESITHVPTHSFVDGIIFNFFQIQRSSNLVKLKSILSNPPNSLSAKQTRSPNTLPQLLGFLQLSLY